MTIFKRKKEKVEQRSPIENKEENSMKHIEYGVHVLQKKMEDYMN